MGRVGVDAGRVGNALFGAILAAAVVLGIFQEILDGGHLIFDLSLGFGCFMHVVEEVFVGWLNTCLLDITLYAFRTASM